jgi:hypothetical protein
VAPVLQCPDCRTKHPLSAATGASFRCSGCGRVLKVPEQYRRAARTGARSGMTGDRPTGTPASPASPRLPETVAATPVRPPGGNGRVPSPAAPGVPLWTRGLLWLVAVPLGFVLVFGFARAIGVLNTNQLEDLFLESGWGRFWPVARLLPFVALLTATIVHFSVYGLARRWSGRGAHAGVPAQPDRARRSGPPLGS